LVKSLGSSNEQFLFLSGKGFHRCFSSERLASAGGFFVVDQLYRATAASVARRLPVVVLLASLREILGDARVEGVIRAPQDVDEPPASRCLGHEPSHRPDGVLPVRRHRARTPSQDTSAGRDLLIAKRRPLLLHAFSLDLANLDFSDAKALAD
jgi:hypothetical protein